MGGKVRTGGEGSGRLRGNGAWREAGEAVCQLLPGSARQPRHRRKNTLTHTHRNMRTSISIYCVVLALPGSESSQTEGCSMHCQSV